MYGGVKMKKNKPTPKQNKWKDPFFKEKMRERMNSVEQAIDGYTNEQYIRECEHHGVKP